MVVFLKIIIKFIIFKSRKIIIESGSLNWSNINPIDSSMMQAIVNQGVSM